MMLLGNGESVRQQWIANVNPLLSLFRHPEGIERNSQSLVYTRKKVKKDISK